MIYHLILAAYIWPNSNNKRYPTIFVIQVFCYLSLLYLPLSYLGYTLSLGPWPSLGVSLVLSLSIIDPQT